MEKIYKYTLPDIPPSNNRFIGRNARWEYQQTKKSWCAMIGFLCRPLPLMPLENVAVQIVYFFPDRKRRDPDNYSGKMILDGLVRNGILKDDCFQNIRLDLSGEYDKKNPRTEITITEG